MFRLTKRSVEALEIRDRDYIEWDRDVAGFGVRVYPSGKKTYLIQYRSGRRTRRYTIGSHGVLTADQARAEAKRLLGDVLRGEDPSGTRRDRRQAPTVKALCERFLKDYAAVHCKPSTNRSYEMLIRLHIKPALGPMLIKDVTRADVAALHLKLSADAPYQANRVLSLLSKLFDLPPEAPSFITRVCGSGFHNLRRLVGQARRARSLQIAQASGALRRAFDLRATNAA